jgi:CDGSH-type Zn-finger protein
MSDSPVTITARENGPYLVTGPVLIEDADGTRYENDRNVVALCRCGGSTNKPFCDGTHSKIGFAAAERAVQKEGRPAADPPAEGLGGSF